MLSAVGRNLAQAVDDLGVGAKLARYHLQAGWPELVGPTLAAHCQPQRLQGRTLWVLTRAPVWSQEVMLRQQAILDAIAQRYPKVKVGQLRCRVGTLRWDFPSVPEVPLPDLTRVTLPPSVEHRLQKRLQEVSDPALRQSMLRALRQKEKRDIWLRQQGAVACQKCGYLQDLPVCRSCRQERRRQKRQQLFQLLGRQPWLTYREAAEMMPGLRQGSFATARRQLLSVWFMDFYRQRAHLVEGQPLPGDFRHLLLNICMLSTSTPWDHLQLRHVRFSLGKFWSRVYLEDRAPAPFQAKVEKESSSGTKKPRL